MKTKEKPINELIRDWYKAEILKFVRKTIIDFKAMESKDIKKEIDKIKLTPIEGSSYCQFSVVENKLVRVYENQDKILKAIKLLSRLITAPTPEPQNPKA